MRKSLVVLSLCAALCLSGCGSNGKVTPPFSADERAGYTVEEAASLFEEAGFTNISTESVSTISTSKIGKVNMVAIDGSYTFGKYNNYVPDSPVIISYYVELEREEPTPENPDQRFADRLDYSLEQYDSMKSALVACGASEADVQTVARIGSHEAALVLGNHSFTINFNNDKECIQICNADAVFYENGEVLLPFSDYLE